MPAGSLIIGRFEKTAGDSQRMYMDFGNEPLLIDGARVASYTVTCVDSGGPTVTGARLDYFYQLSALITGGTAREALYNVVFRIVLDDADASVISRTAGLKIW